MTKFRPELQEDAYYSKYLERQTRTLTLGLQRPADARDVERRAAQLAEIIVGLPRSQAPLAGAGGPKLLSGPTGASPSGPTGPITRLIVDSEVEELAKRHSTNRTLAELHLRRNTWPALVDRFGWDPGLRDDLRRLGDDSLAVSPDGTPKHLTLTELGAKVAAKQQELGIGFNATFPDTWNRGDSD